MKKMSNDYVKLFCFLAFIFIAIVLFRYIGGYEKLLALFQEIEELGKLAPLAFTVVYVAAVIIAVPGSALTAMAGMLFGPVMGVVYVTIASTIGASVTFLLSRYFLRDMVHRKLSGRPSFKKIEDLTEKHGGLFVALVRLIPIFPFSLVNYGFGLTRVPFGIYVVFSAIFMIPGHILYVAGGDVLNDAMLQDRIPWKLMLLAGAIAFLFLVLAKKIRSSL
jgi:uncharacterized membrane protein YdjX (TVP38/TMEM64 family)